MSYPKQAVVGTYVVSDILLTSYAEAMSEHESAVMTLAEDGSVGLAIAAALRGLIEWRQSNTQRDRGEML